MSIEMRHPVETSSKIPTAHVKVFTHAPFNDTVAGASNNAVADILPFSARVASPIRVKYTPDPAAMKQESRVGRITRSATFSFRPLRPGDKPLAPGRIRAPDATLPTLMYASPWLSVTKIDYKDPKNKLDEDALRCLLGQSVFRRKPTDRLEFGSSSKTMTPTSSRLTSPSKSVSCFRSEAASRAISQMSTTKSMASEKRVKIIDPNSEQIEMDENGDSNLDVPDVLQSPPPKSPPRSPSKNVRFPSDKIVNFYSGYLPPELESTIADQLKIRRSKGVERPKEELLPNGKTYKPLVGDRAMYMREPYPTQPKIYQSDVDQLRSEGHGRIQKSNGQVKANFSALNSKQTIIKQSLAESKSFRFGPPPGPEKRHAPIQPRNPPKQSSIDVFQMQRERTYVLQDLAREMLKK